MTACTQPGCTGTIVDGYCDVCGSPAGAAPFIPAGAAASAASPASAAGPGPTAGRRESGFPPKPRNCTQPGCTGTIVDGYCDVCGSPAGAAPFIPAEATAEQPKLAEEEIPTQRIPRVQMTTQPSSTQEKADPAAADTEKAATEKVDPVTAGTDNADTVEIPPVGAVLSGGRHPLPQLPDQQVLGPMPVQNRADTKRFGSLALAATTLAALLIGALSYASRDAGGVMTAQSDPTVTATATMAASKPTIAPSDESTGTRRDESRIQLEGLADSTRPLEAVRIQGKYPGGADTLLRVQRWEEGKWLDFPLPTKTDQSGQFTTYVELGQPGRYRLRVMDPNSGVKSKTFLLVIKG